MGGKNSWELRVEVESRACKDIQGQLGVGEDFSAGDGGSGICLLNTMGWDYWGPRVWGVQAVEV